MPRKRIDLLAWGICAVLGMAASAAWAIPAGEDLLPKTTQAFVAVTNMSTLAEQFQKTQVGKLMADPVMEPFVDDIQQRFQDQWMQFRARLGLKLSDLTDAVGGELAGGTMMSTAGKPAVAVVADVTDRLPQAKALIEKVSSTLQQEGAKRSVINVSETNDDVVLFDIPAPKENPRLGAQKAYYCLTGNLLVGATDLEILKGVLRRNSGTATDNLASSAAFKAVMDRCRQDEGGDAEHQIRWFVAPIGYGEILREATPEEDRPRRSMLELLKTQGFGGMQGIGGFVDLATEGFELIHRTALYAAKPFEKSMVMLEFPAGDDFAPQPWVPRDVATYTTGNIDLLNAFDNIGPLFNETIGRGNEGVWEDTLKSLKEDPNGPQIDLRADLVEQLGQRLTMITDTQTPVTPESERLLFAIEVKDPARVAATVQKFFKDDPAAVRHEEGGHIIWEIVEEEDIDIEPPRVEIGDLPSLTPLEPEEEEEPERLLPHAAVTVIQVPGGNGGQLLVASHMDFLLKILEPKQARETLGRAIDFRVVEATIAKLGSEGQFGMSFSRTDEEYRATYELIRQGKMPQSRSLLGRVFNALIVPETEGGTREQQIPGSKLPDFQVVRRYLGPSGIVFRNATDGWFVKGVMLKRE